MSADDHASSSVSGDLAEDDDELSHGESMHSESVDPSHDANSSLPSNATSDGPIDFSSMHTEETLAGLPSNIEIHPQNGLLPSSSPSQQFIKRPLNAYMIWTRQERQKIVANDPKVKMNEVSKAIQMGERWKAMSDKEKRPYFEAAKKYALEHKKALKEHPNLTYIPPKKKLAKELQQQRLSSDGPSPLSPSFASPPSSSQSTPAPPPMQVKQQPQSVVFRTPHAPAMSPQTRFQPMPLGGQTPTYAYAGTPRTDLTTPGQRPLGAPVAARPTPAQALELYYQSLCQPAFPSLVESPSNPLGMALTPHQYYEQYQQALAHAQL
ncbi:HMG box family protein [Aphelenchoides avenae]|nr:HMG box family protein [Aphelenchus avenae]